MEHKFEVGDVIAKKNSKVGSDVYHIITPEEARKYGYKGDSKTGIYVLRRHFKECKIISTLEQEDYIIVKKANRNNSSITIGIPVEII